MIDFFSSDNIEYKAQENVDFLLLKENIGKIILLEEPSIVIQALAI